MNRHLPLVQRVHPMLPGGGGEETVCAHCHEAWPCTTTALLEALKAISGGCHQWMARDINAGQWWEIQARAAAAIEKAEGR